MSSVSPLVVKPRDACVLLSVGHKKLYQLLADKKLASYREGNLRLITVESIKSYISDNLKASRDEKLRRPT